MSAAPELDWVATDGGYAIAIAGTQLVFRNPRGKVLEAVPRELRHGALAAELERLAGWLTVHRHAVTRSAERLMLEAVSIDVELGVTLWRDPAWRAALCGAVIAIEESDDPDLTPASRLGFLAAIDRRRGTALVDREGGQAWFDVTTWVIPHPLALHGFEEWKRAATALDVRQGFPQLARGTSERPETLSPTATALDRFAGGLFPHSRGLVERVELLGFEMVRGSARVLVRDAGQVIEARYDLGLADSDDGRAVTGNLVFCDASGRALVLDAVPPIAYSEGLRMASSIHDGRRR